ncbi:MAG: hypothetical protein ACI3U1_08755 [Peptococcaceae bacterium]
MEIGQRYFLKAALFQDPDGCVVHWVQGKGLPDRMRALQWRKILTV